MGGSVETNDSHMEERPADDASESAPEFSSLSTAYRSDTNLLNHNSLNYLGPNHGVGASGTLIINSCEPDPDGLCDRDDSTLIDDSSVAIIPNNSGNEAQTSGFGGAMLIVNACLGAGLLNYASAFHEAGGAVAGNVVQAVMLCFIYPALLTLSFCSDWRKAMTLQETIAGVWGRKWERVASVCVCLYCFGTCVTFLIIIGDQFDRILASIYGPYFCHHWYLNRTFTIIASAILFILPFCYPKKIDFLKHISSVGVLSVVYIAVLAFIQYYRGNYTPGEISTGPQSWTDLFLVVPSICFAYQCHVSTIPIYACYKKRDMKTYTWSSFLAITICVLVYTVAGTFGYLTFGNKIKSDLLECYDANDPLVLVAIVAISVKTFTTYPILSFCGNAAVCDMWVDSREAQGVLEVDPTIKNRFRLISVSIWFVLTLLVALFMPNIGAVIKLLGSAAAIFIFIFPGLCFLKMAETSNGLTFYHRPRTFYQVLAGLFITFGGFIFGVVITNAVIADFIKVEADSEPLCLPLPTPIPS